jgi:glycerol-3-phosphate dehydrogenase
MGKEYITGDTVIMGPAYSGPDDREDYSQVREENYYLDMVKPFFPGLKLEDISLHQAGIRAKLKDYYDFVIERDRKYPDLVNLVGIDSPGLTSSLAIAGYVNKLLES